MQNEIAGEFNNCVGRYNLPHPVIFGTNDILTGPKTITTTDLFEQSGGLRSLFFDNFFSQNPWREYHHFTKLSAFRSMIEKGTIRLSAVHKRFSQHEFISFYDDHQMDGYRKRENEGKPMFEGMLKHSFFFSLTCSFLETSEEEKLWDEFAGHGGVRLVFSFEGINTDLRKVYYPASTKNIPLLKDMMAVAARHEKFLVFSALSKVGFFYLPRMFEPEHESRLLISRNAALLHNLSIIQHPDGYDYIELPFRHPLATIKLKKVIPGRLCDENEIRRVLQSRPGYDGVVIQPQF